ncbi:MAG: helix-hairpin-helix domain-containing protein [Syntrophotaleaceae bacterium]
MKRNRGINLLVGILLVVTGSHLGRSVFSAREDPPAFLHAVEDQNWVALGSGFPRPGVHQFIDGQTPRSVIQMSLGGYSLPSTYDERLDRPLDNGEELDLIVKDIEIVEILRKWMPASQRIVLMIPLHPRSMIGEDWMALPGIGPKLAERIEEYRQKNGDFSSLEDLEKVRGIGEKRISAWEEFF